MTVRELINVLEVYEDTAEVDVRVICEDGLTHQREVSGVTKSGRRVVIATYRD